MTVADTAAPLFARKGAARPAPLEGTGELDFPPPPEPAPAAANADGLPLAASLLAAEIRRPGLRISEPAPAAEPEIPVMAATEIRYPLPVPVFAGSRRRRPLWRWLWAGGAAVVAVALGWSMIPSREPAPPPAAAPHVTLAVATAPEPLPPEPLPPQPLPVAEPAVATVPVAPEPVVPPTPSPAPARIALAAPIPAPRPEPAAKGFYAQVASVRSAADAEREWTRLKREHPRLFQGRAVQVDRADVDERGIFYRLRVGPFAERGAAEKLCAQLSARKRDCLVLRR